MPIDGQFQCPQRVSERLKRLAGKSAFRRVVFTAWVHFGSRKSLSQEVDLGLRFANVLSCKVSKERLEGYFRPRVSGQGVRTRDGEFGHNSSAHNAILRSMR
jgi:hypothetical protein